MPIDPTVRNNAHLRLRGPSTEQIEAKQLQTRLVDLNKHAKVGTRSITFRIGSKAVQTDEAIKALLEGKKVKATAVQFKSARGSKMTGGSYYKAKVRVPGVKVATLDSIRDLSTFAQRNVLKSPKDV